MRLKSVGLAASLMSIAFATPLPSNTTNGFRVTQVEVPGGRLRSGPKAYQHAYNKHAPHLLTDNQYTKRECHQANGCVTADPVILDNGYLVPITVGGQTLNVLLDTGSSVL